MAVAKKRVFILGIMIALALLLTAGFATAAVRRAPTLTELFEPLSEIQPLFIYEFQEPIVLVNASLQGVTDKTMAAYSYQNPSLTLDNFLMLEPEKFELESSVSGNSASVRPKTSLFNGYYIFELRVTDFVGNPSSIVKYYILDVPRTLITIIVPRLGASDGTATDLTIRTTFNDVPEATQCKMGTIDPLYDFSSPALVSFDSSSADNSEHTIAGFFTRASIIPGTEFFIVCKDSRESISQQSFPVVIDAVPPVISSFEFFPPKIVEYASGGGMPSVILNITASEQVICKYSIGTDAAYGEKIPFGEYTPFVYDAYKTNHQVSYVLTSVETGAIPFFVECEDRAGWKTKSQKSLSIDLNAPIGLRVTSPPEYTQSTTGLVLVAETDRTAACRFKKVAEVSFQALAPTATRKQHSSPLSGSFTLGTYAYDVCCTSGSGTALQQQEQCVRHEFTIDTTPPGKPNITGSGITCAKNAVSFFQPLTFSALDAESGIDHYEYQVKDGANTLVNWTQAGASISDLEDPDDGDYNLTNTTKLSLIVRAVNNVGKEGQTNTLTVTYSPKAFECQEHTPPTITHNLSVFSGRVEANFFCSDSSGCDNSSLRYGFSANSTNCSATVRADSPPMKVIVLETNYLCYKMSDMVGNNASGIFFVNVSSISNLTNLSNTCSNSKKDGIETGIDCGGACFSCAVNSSCAVNNDCSTNYCANKKCVLTSCADTVQNGPSGKVETDVDCGGHCGATCENGKKCADDNDCESNYCDGTKRCVEASCSDGIKNGDETAIDCGGSCAVECNDRDKDGIDDSWEDNYCDGDCDPDADPDGDGLNNLREFELGTDPTKADTDDDGFSDSVEVRKRTDPLDDKDSPKSSFPLIFVLLGLVLIAGGIAYLIYKNQLVGQAKAGAKPSTPGTGAPPQLSPEQQAAQRAAEEQHRKIMLEQQQRLRETESNRAAIVAERLSKTEQDKQKARERIFGAFGTAKPEQKGAVKQAASPERIVPKPKAIPQAQPASPDEWLSIDDLGKRNAPAASPFERQMEEVKRMEGKPLVSQPSVITPLPVKKEGIKEGAKEAPKEDIFAQLEKVSTAPLKKDEKSDSSALAGLQDLASKSSKKEKKSSAIDQLSMMIGGKK